jgi:hypothetical protein
MRFLNHNFSWVQRVFSGMMTMFLVLALSSSVLVAQVATCCNANRCPIHGHDHKQNHAAEKSGMDCGHDMDDMGAMFSCAMSCCQTEKQQSLTPSDFLLPRFGDRANFSLVQFRPAPKTHLGPFRKIEPTTPPPRISVL